MTKNELMIFMDLFTIFTRLMLDRIGVDEERAKSKEFIEKVAKYGSANINSDEQVAMAALCIGAQLDNADLVSFGTRVEEEER